MDLQKINLFLRPLISAHNGDGSGDGSGPGDGSGDGFGYGSGFGYGYGSGSGFGYGNGDGHGIKLFNKKPVYTIDNIVTIIVSIKNDVAKGFIINVDLTLDSCYVVRNDYYYSHGKTLKEALQSLEEKTILFLPIDKRIQEFKNRFKNFGIKQKALLLYNWHYKLTGSCKMGRDNFIKNHNIDLNKDKLTINEFIELTENSYHGEIIKQLKG